MAGDLAAEFALMRKPSAVTPLIMSLGALVVTCVALATTGTKPEPDEGAAAHIWQLLMIGQIPIFIWFATRWLKRNPRAALLVVGVQIIAFGAALLPVWLLHL